VSYVTGNRALGVEKQEREAYRIDVDQHHIEASGFVQLRRRIGLNSGLFGV